MRKSASLRRLAVLAAFAILACAGPRHATADATPVQTHGPDGCHDERCMGLWYAEFRAGIIAEYRFWQALEPALTGDAMGAQAALNAAQARGMYRHHEWSFARVFEAGPGVPFETLTALLDGCRSAIITLKFMLIDRANGRAPPVKDVADYLHSAHECERTFGVAPKASPLR